MRNTTTLTVALLGLLLVAGSVQAQPAPFPPSLDLTIEYDQFPALSGDYTFTYDPDLYTYVHDGLPDSLGAIGWRGPFTPQTTSGEFVHADGGGYFTFRGTWFDDGFLVTQVLASGITVTGTLIPEPSSLALLLLPLAGVAARRRR